MELFEGPPMVIPKRSDGLTRPLHDADSGQPTGWDAYLCITNEYTREDGESRGWLAKPVTDDLVKEQESTALIHSARR